MVPSPSRLVKAIEGLVAHHGKPGPAPSRDPFALAVWECCAYLVDDGRRRQVFQAIRRRVGLDPESILSASDRLLEEVLAPGGMHPHRRAGKVRDCARIALDVGLPRLRRMVRESSDEARKVLRRFPGIGEPGAEKILLLAGSGESLGVDSNGLRVLLRLGYGTEGRSYSTTYRSAMRAAVKELPRDHPFRVRAHQVLRTHGREICRRTRPLCEECPVTGHCRFFRDRGPVRTGG